LQLLKTLKFYLSENKINQNGVFELANAMREFNALQELVLYF